MSRLGRIFNIAAAAALAGAGMVHSAFAADLPAAAPLPPAPPVAAVNWTGFYLGGDVAGIFNDARYFRPLSGLSDTSIGKIDPRPAYGVYGGFNYQILPWAVIGLEGNYTWLSGADYRELGPFLDFLQESRHVSSFTGRAGVLLRPDTLVYGKVGPAWIETQGFQGFGTAFRTTVPGIQAGAGIESLVTPNIALRAEVSYTYADRLLSLNQGFDLYRPNLLMLSLGLAYKFDPPQGWGAPAPASAVDATPDMVYKAAQPAALPHATNWTGVEAGGFVSANGNQVRYHDTLNGDSGPYTDFDFGGGWFAGANYQFQRIVLGAEVSGNYESANFNHAAGSGGFVSTHYNFAKIDRVLAVTGRVGWLATPDTLLYAKAGPSDIRLTPNPIYFNSIAPNATPSTNFPGYQAGIGAETYVLPNLSIRVEGVYTHTGHRIVLNGTVPNEFTLQPSVLATTLGAALHF